mmetsp:Transcript_17767/g.45086  ORF Transcript_17767/g.45086 Transcript_17767/m.45086 type:complete len:256 (+) Transcript_17767:241-1008(+)
MLLRRWPSSARWAAGWTNTCRRPRRSPSSSGASAGRRLRSFCTGPSCTLWCTSTSGIFSSFANPIFLGLDLAPNQGGSLSESSVQERVDRRTAVICVLCMRTPVTKQHYAGLTNSTCIALPRATKSSLRLPTAASLRTAGAFSLHCASKSRSMAVRASAGSAWNCHRAPTCAKRLLWPRAGGRLILASATLREPSSWGSAAANLHSRESQAPGAALQHKCKSPAQGSTTAKSLVGGEGSWLPPVKPTSTTQWDHV